jgi:hypothetical protein
MLIWTLLHIPEEIGNLEALTYLSLVFNDGLTGGLENTPLCALESFRADCATGCVLAVPIPMPLFAESMPLPHLIMITSRIDVVVL